MASGTKDTKWKTAQEELRIRAGRHVNPGGSMVGFALERVLQ